MWTPLGPRSTFPLTSGLLCFVPHSPNFSLVNLLRTRTYPIPRTIPHHQFEFEFVFDIALSSLPRQPILPIFISPSLRLLLNGNTEQPTSPRLPFRHAQRPPRPTAIPEIDHNTCRPGRERGCKARNKRKRCVRGCGWCAWPRWCRYRFAQEREHHIRTVS